jgi:hypothetical protein
MKFSISNTLIPILALSSIVIAAPLPDQAADISLAQRSIISKLYKKGKAVVKCAFGNCDELRAQQASNPHCRSLEESDALLDSREADYDNFEYTTRSTEDDDTIFAREIDFDDSPHLRDLGKQDLSERSFFKKVVKGIKKVGKKLGGVGKVLNTASSILARDVVVDGPIVEERSFFRKLVKGVKSVGKIAGQVARKALPIVATVL